MFVQISLVVLLYGIKVCPPACLINMKGNINFQSTAMFCSCLSIELLLWRFMKLMCVVKPVNTFDILSEVKINASQAVHTLHKQ